MSCSSTRLESKNDEYSQVRLRRSDEWLGSKQEPAGLCGDNENTKPIRGTLYSVDCWPSILEVREITTNATRKTKIGLKQENEPSADQPSQPTPITAIHEKHQLYSVMFGLFFGHFFDFFVQVYSALYPAVYRNNAIVSILLSCLYDSVRETFINTFLSPLETSQLSLTFSKPPNTNHTEKQR